MAAFTSARVTVSSVVRLVLPADEELWAKHPAGGSADVQIIVTKVA